MIDVQNVRVKFVSIQEQDGHRENQSKVLGGKRYERRGATCLQFRDDVGEEEIVTAVEIADQRVQVRRSGAVTSEMNFALDVPDEFAHRSAFGCVFFEIRTKKLDVRVTEDEIDVHITYELMSNRTIISTNHIHISAK